MPNTTVTLSATFKNNRKKTVSIAGTAIKFSELVNAKRDFLAGLLGKDVHDVVATVKVGRKKERVFRQFADKHQISLKTMRAMHRHLKHVS